MSGGEIASIILAVGGVLTGILGWIIRRPGQKETDAVEVAGGVLSVANNTVEMIAGQFQAEFTRMSTQLAEEREERKKERLELRAQHAEQLAEERKQAAAIKKAMTEAHTEAASLRQALRETQAECDKWRTKYEREIGKAT